MRLRKRLLKRSPNREVLDAICQHYHELRSELVQSVPQAMAIVRNSQTAEDILHDAIYHVACECPMSGDVSDTIVDILERVRQKYHSLRIGLEREERGRKEVLTDRDLGAYGEDN